MYGLKPVPFKLKPEPFGMKLAPLKLKPVPFKLKPEPFGLKLAPFKLQPVPFGLKLATLKLTQYLGRLHLASPTVPSAACGQPPSQVRVEICSAGFPVVAS